MNIDDTLWIMIHLQRPADAFNKVSFSWWSPVYLLLIDNINTDEYRWYSLNNDTSTKTSWCFQQGLFQLVITSDEGRQLQRRIYFPQKRRLVNLSFLSFMPSVGIIVKCFIPLFVRLPFFLLLAFPFLNVYSSFKLYVWFLGFLKKKSFCRYC